MTEKQFTAIKEQIADATNIIELDEFLQVLFEDYFKSGKPEAVKSLYNKHAKRSNELMEFERHQIIGDKTKPPKKAINEDDAPVSVKRVEHKNKAGKVQGVTFQEDEDLIGGGDLLGESKPKKKAKPAVDDDDDDDLIGGSKTVITKFNKGKGKKATGKPGTGKRVKALVEKGTIDFAKVVAVLTKEEYKFTENSVRWYISKAKKGEL